MPTHLERDVITTPGPGAAGDFWRTSDTNVAGAFPDGVNDTIEIIHREGRVAIQNVLGAIPAFVNPPMLDIANGARSGVDGRNTLDPLYATGNISGFNGTPSTPPATPTIGSKFLHSNQTQGIGIGFDVIYATGSNIDQALNFMNRGSGQISFYQQALLGFAPGMFYNYVGPAVAAGQGWNHRWFAAGALEYSDLRRRSSLALPGGGTLGNEIFFQKRASGGGIHNALALRNSLHLANNGRIEVGGNEVVDDKLVLFGVDSGVNFFGFGIKSSTLASFVSSTGGFFRWFETTNPTVNLFSVSGVGNVTVDPSGLAAGVGSSPVLRFGSESSAEWIRSQRTVADRFQNDIEIETAGARRFAVLNNGRIYMAVVPTFATDALAGAGGLATGEVYKDALGTLKIKL